MKKKCERKIKLVTAEMLTSYNPSLML